VATANFLFSKLEFTKAQIEKNNRKKYALPPAWPAAALIGIGLLQSAVLGRQEEGHPILPFAASAMQSDSVYTSGSPLPNAATVTTDRSDYAPGSTVTITGSVCQPGETVSNQVTQIVGPAAAG
jgi:hypothetical protein